METDPRDIKDNGNIKKKKNRKEVEKRKCDVCPCRMCKTYIQSVGFIN